jgi:BolA protein
MTKGERKNRIEQVIIEFLSPQYFSIVDDSADHKGHSGAPKEGESHFTIIIKSQKFSGKTRIERERMVQKLLLKEFESGLHALTMHLETP